MRTFFNISLITAICTLAIGCSVQSGYLKIQETKLKDSVVRREIVKLVETRAYLDSTFRRGYGYITVGFYTMRKGDTLAHYMLSPSVLRHDEGMHFPPYYTFIDQKLVLVYDLILSDYVEVKYSHSSKKKLIKLIDKFIDPLQRKEEKESSKEFRKALEEQYGTKSSGSGRKDELVHLYYGASTEIYVLRNGKYIINYNVNP